MSVLRRIAFFLAPWLLAAAPASAQVFGTFPWQMQPYCNVVTLTLTSTAAGFVLDGVDDQCGAANKASAIGVASFNQSGNVTLNFTIVQAPSAQPLHVSAVVSVGTGSGTWTDSLGNTGTFAFFGNTAGLPARPVPIAPGTEIAHAAVDGTSFLFNRGFSAVTRPTTGVYCLTPILPAGLTVADVYHHVSVEWASSFGFDLSAFGSYNNSFGCSAGQIPVHTYQLTGSPVTGVASSNNVAFVISLYRR